MNIWRSFFSFPWIDMLNQDLNLGLELEVDQKYQLI